MAHPVSRQSQFLGASLKKAHLIYTWPLKRFPQKPGTYFTGAFLQLYPDEKDRHLNAQRLGSAAVKNFTQGRTKFFRMNYGR